MLEVEKPVVPILIRRKEAKRRILQARKEHNHKVRELDRGNSTG